MLGSHPLFLIVCVCLSFALIPPLLLSRGVTRCAPPLSVRVPLLCLAAGCVGGPEVCGCTCNFAWFHICEHGFMYACGYVGVRIYECAQVCGYGLVHALVCVCVCVHAIHTIVHDCVCVWDCTCFDVCVHVHANVFVRSFV